MAESHHSTAKGAYSSVTLPFGDLIVTTSAIVLKLDNYDLLIGTDFLKKYQALIDMKIGFMSLMGYSVLLLFNEKPFLFVYLKQIGPHVHTMVKYNHGILGLPYQLKLASTQKLPILKDHEKGILLRADHLIVIKHFNQVCAATSVIIDVPSEMLLLISSLPNPSIKEPIEALGIQDEGDLSELKVLLLNLTQKNI